MTKIDIQVVPQYITYTVQLLGLFFAILSNMGAFFFTVGHFKILEIRERYFKFTVQNFSKFL